MSADPAERDWKLRVEDILACIDKIQSYTAGMDLGAFTADTKTVDAVIRNFEIIGEGAGRIPEEVQDRYPDLAWLEMLGMRNLIIHAYFRVSLPILWHTIQNDLEPLAAGLQQMLSDSE
jgi:uncharacterized protein with HEPN domain